MGGGDRYMQNLAVYSEDGGFILSNKSSGDILSRGVARCDLKF